MAKKKNPKVGRPSIYDDGKQLRAAIERYFDAITFVEDVKANRPVTQIDESGNEVPCVDERGHIRMQIVPVMTVGGKQAVRARRLWSIQAISQI